MSMSTKQHVCPLDGRRFATKQALRQHRLTVHGAGPKPNPAPSRQRTVAQVGLAQASLLRGSSADSATISGTDRIASISLNKSMKGSSILVNLLINPSAFSRLSGVARAFQRIRYRKLVFRVQPQISTLTGGGYVAAFIRDPADEPVSVQALTCQRNSATTKWWQSASVSAEANPTLFYTSESVEVREYSPGRFVLMVDNPPTQDGSLVVLAEWAVELSVASFESDRQTAPTRTAEANLYTRHTQVGFWRWTGTGPVDQDKSEFWSNDIRMMFSPQINAGEYLRLRVPIPFPASNGMFRTMNWVYAQDWTTLIPAFSDKGDLDHGAAAAINLVIGKGSVLDLDMEVQGGETGPSSLETMALPPPSASLPASSSNSEKILQEILTQLQRLSATLSQPSQSPPELLDSPGD